ncbi:MAG: ATP-binding cassette domain-containing protein [Chloroflexota bacterium]|nr:MAG: ATP-binding cassette domain-containing protein [Chloroflexota bacterium]
MGIWNSYPPDYRSKEVNAVTTAVLAGECVSIVGLSGAGKSNLMGFLANRASPLVGNAGSLPRRLVMVDCNRLQEKHLFAVFSLI